ncbi:MAG: phospho-sugar mutase [Marinilabiliales bacterium]|nr:MAG: phospho-sugar mutase [Marinilabiliales bacterium]
MEKDELLTTVRDRAKAWMSEDYDPETVLQVKALLEGPENELIDAFYRDLEFGTGGLRGVMGAGTNRVNIYTIGMATQGLSNYLHKQFPDIDAPSAAIAYDNRNNSRLFAETAAGILTANGIDVWLFEDLRPTPELSFAIRHYGCQTGIVITASHNPKEYNGYKVYWDDGAQIIAPHDAGIIAEVRKVKSISQVNRNARPEKVKIIGEETDDIYIGKIREMSLSPSIVAKHSDMKIVFTPIHGASVKLVPMALRSYGFTGVIPVPEQDVTDGNFPTVISPNPEEAAALEMALDKARETGAELVMGSDPDGDRVGIAVKDNSGELLLLNGNQAASLMLYYILKRWEETNRFRGNEFIAKTIVTSGLLSDIAEKFGVECYDVLTGFKFIAGLIREYEGEKTFIAGFEESYGYLAGDLVRDKDAVISCALIAEAAAWAREMGRSLYDLLIDLYLEFGLYRETLVSVVRKGKSGAEEIAGMMDRFRNSPPETIAGSQVMTVHDYLKQKSFDSISHLRREIKLPKSNVLQFLLNDGSLISVRPSGTEPKIKFYISVRGSLERREDYPEACRQLDERASNILSALGVS